MTDEQAKEIFEAVIIGHWPNWPASTEECFVWIKALKPFDFGVVKDAINEFYTKWDSERYPKMPRILAAIREYAKSHRLSAGIAKLFQIENEEGKLVWKPFWGNPETPHQELEPIAERLCKEADRMFPNHKHIANWFDPKKVEPEGYYGPDARDRAFQAILEGPNCGAKRFLEGYLNAKEKREWISRRQQAKQKQEPVAIGQVLEADVPF